MAKKATSKAKIKNDPKESPIDAIIKEKDNLEPDWSVKSLEAESDTKLESDVGEGQAITLRHFWFKPNPEEFKKRIPTAQELLNSHLKQMEIELWKDSWSVFPEVEPRLLFFDKLYRPVSHTSDKIEYYCFIVAAVPSKGSLLSYLDKPKKLAEIAHESRGTKE